MPTRRKITVEQEERPPQPIAATALRYTLIEAGKQGRPARYAMDAVCDDGVVRTFIVGGGKG